MLFLHVFTTVNGLIVILSLVLDRDGWYKPIVK